MKDQDGTSVNLQISVSFLSEVGKFSAENCCKWTSQFNIETCEAFQDSMA